MPFLGISLQVWQTILIIAFPFLFGLLPRFKALYHRFRSSSSAQTGDTPTQQRLSIKEWTLRLGWARLSLLVVLFTTLILRTTRYNPSRSNPFTLTKLPLNTSTVSLTAALARIYRARGLADTPSHQQRLVQRLTSLDSRLLFSLLGPDSLLHCRWCRPPSKEGTHLNDHLLYALPRVASHYAMALLSLGLITTHALSLEAKRRAWRLRTSSALLACLLLEAIFLSVLLNMPALAMNAKHEGRMLGDKLFVARHVLFGFLFAISAWSVATEKEESNTTALARLGLQIGTVSHQLDTLVGRLRIAALQRSTIMRDENYRLQSNEFWKYAESQERVASQDKGVRAMRNQLGLGCNGPNRDELQKWIENAYPVPSVGPLADLH